MHGFSEQSSFSGTCFTGNYNKALACLDAVTESGPGLLINRVGVIKPRVGRHAKWRFTEFKMSVVHATSPGSESSHHKG